MTHACPIIISILLTQWFADVNRTSTWIFLLLLCILKNFSADDCPRGWMGPNCRFKCRCQIGCLATGECVPGDTCQKNYFGDACQHQDLVQLSKIGQVSPILTDSDDSTCMLTDRSKVYFYPTQLTFIRIVVSEEETFNKISFLIKDESSQDVCEPALISTPVRPYVRDYFCFTKTQVTELTFQSNEKVNLCTVNVNGDINTLYLMNFQEVGINIKKSSVTLYPLSGYLRRGCDAPFIRRNLALKQHFKASSTELNSTDMGGNDGEYPPNDSSKFTGDNTTCLFTSRDDNNSSFTIWFNVPVMIYSIVIINIPDLEEQFHLNDLVLYTYDSMKETLLRYIDNSVEASYMVRIDNTADNDKPVSSIKLSKTKTNYSGALKFCELEAFGDCVRGYYGLDCAQRCGNCTDGFCRLFGECITLRCIDGAYGPKCDKGCSDNCGGAGGCNVTSGNCKDGCKVGFVGAMCTERNQKTDNATETITIMTDKATQTNGTFTSSRTMTKCSDGMYGVNCSMACSKSCSGNKSCHQETGRCSEGCIIGIGGADCSTGQHAPFATYYIILIMLFVAVLCLGICTVLSRTIPHLERHE